MHFSCFERFHLEVDQGRGDIVSFLVEDSYRRFLRVPRPSLEKAKLLPAILGQAFLVPIFVGRNLLSIPEQVIQPDKEAIELGSSADYAPAKPVDPGILLVERAGTDTDRAAGRAVACPELKAFFRVNGPLE